MASQTKPHILEHPVSSYAQKIKIALREKGVEFTSEVPSDISSTNGGPLHETNPRVEVPVLLHDGNTIFDSTIILEYVEDVWPEPALLPKDPGQRATARMIEDVCDTTYEALNWVSRTEQTPSSDINSMLTRTGTRRAPDFRSCGRTW